MTFPTEFTISTLTSSQCKLTNVYGLSSYSCSITNNVLTITNPFNGATTATGQVVKFTLSSTYITNPTSTRPTTTGIVVASKST